MMRNKFLILLFGLLLAVGWTSDAHAQKLRQDKPWYQSPFFQRMKQPTMMNDSQGQRSESLDNLTAIAEGTNGNMLRAPRRANYNQTSPVTHIKSWYDGKHYNWYDAEGNFQGSPSYTEAVTDSCQMFWFIRSLYSDQTMPGIKYSIAQNDGDGNTGFDLAYEGCDFGYWVSGDVTQDIYVRMSSNCYITAIYVSDYAGNIITSYDAEDDLPTGWTMPNSSSMTKSSEYVNTSSGYEEWYYWKLTSTSATTFTAAFRISKDLLAGKGGVYVDVLAKQVSSSSESRDYTCYVNRYNYNKGGYYVGEKFNMSSDWDYYTAQVNGPVTPPDDDANGYSVVLVKLKDDFGDRPEMYTDTDSALYSYYNKYVKELQLLTDGLRVNENTDAAGTLFAYSGDLNKFYYISKGKLYPIGGSENSWTTDDDSGEYVRSADRAPFYNMYEEFSPYVESGHEDHSDLYSELQKGTTYPILHDCQSVSYMRHHFAITGEDGTSENRVNCFVLYIPDNRGQQTSRTYSTEHQPTVGMYMIDLYADIEPSETPDYYTTTVTWFDNLDAITHSEGIPQTYYLYQIIDGDTTCVTPNGTDQTSWTGEYPVTEDGTSYDIHYFVIGIPTAATNPETFYAQSNTDDVTVPGKYDFIGLQWWRYESDYVAKNVADPTNNEVNYYRNWLAPHKLSTEGQTGIRAGNVGTHGRTLTLYRENTPIIDLELVMNGNKAYYRIKYRDAENNQQIEPGYGEDGELIRNNNN